MSKPYENIPGKEFWAAQAPGGHIKPKTSFKVSFPPGDRIKLLNLADISAPGGVTIEFKLPFPMSEAGLSKLFESIRASGGTVEM